MDVIAKVNQDVSFLAVCQLAGMEVPSEIPAGGSVKVFCPFGFHHRDRGATAAFRVYAVNNGFCFAGCGFYDPVRLAAAVWDCSAEQAAQRLAEMFGVRPDSASWEQVAAPVPEPEVDRAALAAALHEYCARQFPGWEDKQFTDSTAASLGRCLSLLDRVSSADDAYKWLDVAKRVMRIHMIGEG